MSLKSICILWRNFLSNCITCRLLKIWQLMYCQQIVTYEPSVPIYGTATQQWSFCSTSIVVLNQVCLYLERVYAHNVVSEFWFVSSFSSQHHAKSKDTSYYKYVPWVRNERSRTRFFIFQVNLFFLRSSIHFSCDTSFAVIVSLSHENFYTCSNLHNGWIKTGFQVMKFEQFWRVLLRKHESFQCKKFSSWWVRFFWICNLPLTS